MSQPAAIVSGVDAIAVMFARAREGKRAAFLPYFPIGYPDYSASLDAIEAMSRAGADGFEIGIPFSDPLADGRVIQQATQQALANGTTVTKCLDAVRELRARGVHQPILLMGYVNPLLAYGIERFVADARAAGADGLLFPDLPVEEGAPFREACARAGLALVFFLAPTSSDERVRLVASQATGFIYVVSLTGIPGERTQLAPDLLTFLARVRAQAGDMPLVLGFGISAPEHVIAIREHVDGFAVGTAMVRAGGQGIDAVRALAEQLRAATSNE